MIKEDSLTDAEFRLYQRMIYDACGIKFTDSKKQLLISRLRKRMEALKVYSFREYREYVTSPKHKDEFSQMLNVITTNKTDFFREPVHFDFLARQVYPNLQKQHGIRVWSAASSSGEEPYTLAMTLLEGLGPQAAQKDIKILATDLSTKVLEEAQRGIYSLDAIGPVPNPLVKRYFLKGTGQWEGHCTVKENIRKMVHFRRLNLMEPLPLSVEFDFIFCRNVMIYFDEITRENLVARMIRFLKPGGYFFVGNAESLSGLKHDLKYVEPSIYQKRKDNK